MHHAILDGVSAAELVAALFDLSPDPSPRPLFAGGRTPSPIDPSATGTDAVAEHGGEDGREEAGGAAGRAEPAGAAGWRELLSSVTRQVDAVSRSFTGGLHAASTVARRRAEPAPVPRPFAAPRTSINRSISPHRRAAVADLPMGDVRRVRDVLGGTTNDVVLACVAGALRRLFAERGETLEGPLVAMVPVSVRTAPELGELGNRVSVALASLASTVEDPADRLEAIRTGMVAAKEQSRSIGAGVFEALAQAAVPAVATRVSRLVSNLGLFDRMAPPFNLIVSNVPGPDFPLYLDGAQLVALYPFGPIVEGVGVNVTVFSYLDTLHVGVQACWDLVPEVVDLAAAVRGSLDELVIAAARRNRPVPWWHSELPA